MLRCLSRRPHIANTGRVKAFVVTKNSASLWLGKQGNDQLQRVYGISFPDKKEFAEWKHFQEQAAKRDHRKIGLEQVRVRARVGVRVRFKGKP